MRDDGEPAVLPELARRAKALWRDNDCDDHCCANDGDSRNRRETKDVRILLRYSLELVLRNTVKTRHGIQLLAKPLRAKTKSFGQHLDPLATLLRVVDRSRQLARSSRSEDRTQTTLRANKLLHRDDV